MTAIRTLDSLRMLALAVLPLGPVQSLPSVPSWSVESDQVGAQLGIAVAPAGDVNGDGFGDVLAGAHLFDGGETDEGRALLWLGSVTGLASLPAWSVEGDQDGARLGACLALAGDVNGDGYSDVLVGARAFDGGESDEGMALLFLGSSTGLATTPAWTAEGNQVSAELGAALAPAGDVDGDGFDDVLVGAPLFDGGELDEGRAYLYLGSSTGLAASPAWTAEPDVSGAEFGARVATAGDVNGDGYGDVLVGAWRLTNGEADEGRAYAYLGSATGLALAPAWTTEGDQIDARFGSDVGAAGDVNGDGFGDVIIGASSFDVGVADAGRALVFLGSSSGLGASPAWTTEPGLAPAHVGNAVATAGDVNGDGYSDVLVGAFLLAAGELDEGGVSAFRGAPSGLATSPGWTSRFGPTITFYATAAYAGDVNGDGYGDVIVGDPHDDTGGSNHGRVYAFYGSAAGPSPTPDWSVIGLYPNGEFGRSVASAGDVDGDGFDDVLASSLNLGRVGLFRGRASGLRHTPAWTVDFASVGADIGSSLAPAGDVNGDGYGDVIIGAIALPLAHTGSAFVYLGSSSGLGPTPAWRVSGGTEFAWSVASAGDVNGDGFSDVLVGDRFASTAKLYLGSPSGPSPVADWSVTAGYEFGESVASAGDVNGDGYSDVIIGSPLFSPAVVCMPQCRHEGRAYVYLGSAAGLATSPAWIGEGLDAFGQHGGSVASAGDVNGDGYSDILVGAPLFGAPQVGRAYAYLGSPTGPALQPSWFVEGPGHVGYVLASAGDVNGDGFADVVSTAEEPGSPSFQLAVRVYLGNQGSGGRVRLLQQRTRDDARRLAPLDGTGPTGLFRLRAGFPGLAGAGWASPSAPEAFLEWEVEPLGTPFDGEDLQRSPLGVALALPGGGASFDELGYLARRSGRLGDRRGGVFAWRARVLTNNPLFPRTAWFGQAGSAQTEAKVRAASGRLR